MWKLIQRHKIRSAIWFHVSAYILFFLTLLTNNAVVLVLLLPAAFMFLFGGVWLWLVSVLKEAKEKELL